MLCPECGGETYIVDSRERKQGKEKRRRRICHLCNFKFTTREVMVLPAAHPRAQLARKLDNKDITQITGLLAFMSR